MHRRLTATLIAAGLLIVPACGDDEGDSADGGKTTTTAAAKATGTDAKFCDAVLAGDEMFGSEDAPDPAEADAVLGNVSNTAPAAVKTEVDKIVTETKALVAAGDEGPGPSDEYLASLDEVHKWMADNCGWTSLESTATEYAFSGIPTTVKAGPAVIALKNDGKEVHELNLVRINDGVTESVEDLIKLPEEEANAKITPAGQAFAVPGTTGYSAANLTPGRYAAVCFIPEGTTPENMDAVQSGEAEEATPHALLGMHSEFTVS